VGETRGCLSLALVGQVAVQRLVLVPVVDDFSAYYKLEHMVHLHVASVRRQTKMNDFFAVPNR